MHRTVAFLILLFFFCAFLAGCLGVPVPSADLEKARGLCSNNGGLTTAFFDNPGSRITALCQDGTQIKVLNTEGTNLIK